MSELNYIFKKGEGWIPIAYFSKTVMNRNHETVRFELRDPIKGEFFMNCSKSQNWRPEDWEQWVISSSHVFKGDPAYVYPVHTMREDQDCCVLIWE